MCSPFNKDFWPRTFDEWRVVPRLLVALYGLICWNTHQWFTALADPTASQMGYAATIWGAAAVWFGVYLNSKPTPREP